MTIYRSHRDDFLSQHTRGRAGDFPLGDDFPQLGDRRDEAGVASGHYFHQDLWVAQQIFRASPTRHIDVGSRVDGFVSHVAVFRPIEVFDIRPLTTSAENITFQQVDLMSDVASFASTTDSLSCLHALEHFGLGRYGDPINVDGWHVGLNHLIDILEPGGRLYLSTPIGPQRVEFDAHRVFAVPFLREHLNRRCEVADFAYVDDAGGLHPDVDIWSAAAEQSFGCTYGCGIFIAIRRK